MITVDRVRQTLLAEAAYSDRLLEAAKLRDDGKGWVDEYARGRVSGIRLALKLLEEIQPVPGEQDSPPRNRSLT